MVTWRARLSTLIGIGVSIAAVAALAAIVSPAELARSFSTLDARFLPAFAGACALMCLCFGLRWRLLLDGRISARLAVQAVLVNLGGNMVLPARGGDLLRLHFSAGRSELPVTAMLGTLLTEKIADLLAICLVGVVGGALLGVDERQHQFLVIAASALLAGILGALLLVRRHGALVHRFGRWLAGKAGQQDRFDRYAGPLVRAVADSLEPRLFLRAMGITLFLWLAIYAACYLLVGRLVGTPLSYPEALIVLWASGLGLMIPAAPSGLGVYHAAIVSAFYFLGRPAAEGLALATTAHLCFFVILVVPMVLLYGRHFLRRTAR